MDMAKKDIPRGGKRRILMESAVNRILAGTRDLQLLGMLDKAEAGRLLVVGKLLQR